MSPLGFSLHILANATNRYHSKNRYFTKGEYHGNGPNSLGQFESIFSSSWVETLRHRGIEPTEDGTLVIFATMYPDCNKHLIYPRLEILKKKKVAISQING